WVYVVRPVDVRRIHRDARRRALSGSERGERASAELHHRSPIVVRPVNARSVGGDAPRARLPRCKCRRVRAVHRDARHVSGYIVDPVHPLSMNNDAEGVAQSGSERGGIATADGKADDGASYSPVHGRLIDRDAPWVARQCELYGLTLAPRALSA